jgi:hypothetical protein
MLIDAQLDNMLVCDDPLMYVLHTLIVVHHMPYAIKEKVQNQQVTRAC